MSKICVPWELEEEGVKDVECGGDPSAGGPTDS
jgi:hypothetical protein